MTDGPEDPMRWVSIVWRDEDISVDGNATEVERVFMLWRALMMDFDPSAEDDDD